MANFIRQYFFAPWSNRNFERFEALFENESKTFPKNLARKFRKFLKYLNKFYFSDNAPFSPGFYPYFDLITETGNFSTSTNALESINRQLKRASGSGFLSFSKSCRVLRDFKTNYLLLHEDRVSNDNLNRRKKSTLIREQQLETILEDFSSLNPEQQLNSVIKFSYKIGTIEKFVDLSQNLENSEKYLISTATTEEELDDTIYQTFCDSDSELDSDPESDSESEF